ncbi:MAG: hypothetical protein ACD_81C00232G0002 [uncultured bacterium]|uniref:Uncharacterized protein n=1 Tax=Candidatus Wolfebacteria bacterium GW2011_GWE2_44_13 TaxID=1619017 RepID=A0A0G1HA53_9BACT|nr:MAG: hypothetical protein ACD_81C00232G0002 [uncultured bacterium]KKT43428.1 MAG: hypothetical protein UW32_C0001G0020 [Candidatus Wolfebacteria bacterium GW2011_GWE2_44_13]
MNLEMFIKFGAVIAVFAFVFRKDIHFGRNVITIPDKVMEEMNRISKERGEGRRTLITKFFKLGILVANIDKDPKVKIIIEEEGKEPVHLLL